MGNPVLNVNIYFVDILFFCEAGASGRLKIITGVARVNYISNRLLGRFVPIFYFNFADFQNLKKILQKTFKDKVLKF